MSFQRFTVLAIASSLLLSPSLVLADYTYQETTQITGGSMVKMMKMAGAFSSQARKAGDPVVSTVYIQGNRMAKVAQDSIEIIDLDKETITHADTLKHTYTVMTFQQIREQMAKAAAEAEKRHPTEPAAPAAKNPDDVKTSFDVKVRNTGAEKQVSGLSAHEAIMTMTMKATDQTTQQSGNMAVTNDMWMVAEIPGYDQVREFYIHMGQKMGSTMASGGGGMDMSAMLAQNPGATQAMTDMAKEVEKIKGVPVMQVMRMGTTMDGKPLPAASEAPLPPDNSPAMPSGGDMAKQGMASALSSKLGGFGFGKKKKEEQPAADPNASQNAAQAQAAAVILMETQTTTSNFSSDPVDGSHFEVPAGYKLVEMKMR
jgi:hypothetical protein